MLIHFKKRKLRVDILTIFLTLFLGTVACIIYYTNSRSNEAVLKVANDLIQETNDSIIKKLDNFLRPIPFVKISGNLLSDQVLTSEEMQSLSSFMHVMLETYPQLINVYVADIYGNIFLENNVSSNPLVLQNIPFFSNKKIPSGTIFLSQDFKHTDNASELTLIFHGNEGQILETDTVPNVKFDPRSRPWYIGAKKLSAPWIGVYQFYNTAKQGITIAFPIISRGIFDGVAAADLSIDLIADELQNYSLSEHGTFFIVNKESQIITSHENLFNENNTEKLPLASNINNPLIKTAFALYQKNGDRHFIFKQDGVSYIANFTSYSFSPTEDWEIGGILPVDIFVGTLEKANNQILIFSVLMLCLGLMLIIIYSHQISRPIIRLAQETKDMVKFNFEKETKIHTHIYEVQIMIDALNATKATLSSFVKYVPKVLVQQLFEKRKIAQLGGEKRKISALFTDIANFTEMSEKLDPEFLMLHLSEYLNALTHRIQDLQGNIDKYIGDAIMAFWSAPLDDSQHAFHACQAILTCQREVQQLNEKWKSEGKPTFPTRFGLNTGTAVVGNMGSSDRLNYTAIGDSINLAARLQTLNKTYHTTAIVSESVYEICANQFLFRPLDVVQVRGKQEFTQIYELVAEKPGAKDFPPSAEQIELCDLTWKGYNAFQQKDFKQAEIYYKKISERFPQDEVARIYLERCKAV